MKTLLSFLLLMLFTTSDARITVLDSMDEIVHMIEMNNCDTLAIFDIDMVLIQPRNPAFQIPNLKRYHECVQRIISRLPKEKRDLFLTLLLFDYDPILVDPHTPALLYHLSRRHIPSIALTSSLTGKLGMIKNLESWEIDNLRNLGIDFTSSAPIKEPLVFMSIPSYRGNYSLYQNGILFTNGSNCKKGDLLVKFLQETKLSPKRIVFIDDQRENLQNMESTLLASYPSIQFEGIHYLGANNYPSQHINRNEFENQWIRLAMNATELN